MIRRYFVKIIKLFVFGCILLYTVFFFNQLFDLEENAPAINNFLARIAAIPIPGVGTLGALLCSLLGALHYLVLSMNN